jgi:hypothetical protein
MSESITNKKIVLNQAICLDCNTVLKSYNQIKVEKCNCNNESCLSGGLVEVKIGGKDPNKIKLLTLYSTDDHTILRDFCEWNVYVTKNNSFISYKIKDLGDEQIYDLLHNGFMVDEYKHILKQELNYRNDNK